MYQSEVSRVREAEVIPSLILRISFSIHFPIKSLFQTAKCRHSSALDLTTRSLPRFRCRFDSDRPLQTNKKPLHSAVSFPFISHFIPIEFAGKLRICPDLHSKVLLDVRTRRSPAEIRWKDSVTRRGVPLRPPHILGKRQVASPENQIALIENIVLKDPRDYRKKPVVRGPLARSCGL
jgi:hypothetical protein